MNILIWEASMSGTVKMKRNGSPETTQPATKRKKGEDGCQNFLSPVIVYILQAGIEKLRMKIFREQLVKFGGSLREGLCTELTHVIVDDKMDADRMCRLLKVDKPPEIVEIVKSSWLSACFKEKKLLETHPYLLDLSVLEVKPTTKKPEKDLNTVQDEKGEAKSELAKVGMMFGHKLPKQHNADNDDDSDYIQSDADSETAISDAEASTSASNTPASSPKKFLPVSYRLRSLYLLLPRCKYI